MEREPVTPGEVLKVKFMDPLGITQIELADRLLVERRRINEIVLGKRELTPDTAIRLARAFGVSPLFWLTLQAKRILWVTQNQNAGEYERIPSVRS